MAYNNLIQLTLTADERFLEAARILRIIGDDSIDQFSQREQEFLEQMGDSKFISEKQLLWLRDLLGKIQ